MRILLIILSFLIFRQSATVCPQALQSDRVATSYSEQDDVECSNTLLGHSCCKKKSNSTDDENTNDHHHKCKCMTSIASFVLLNRYSIDLSNIAEISVNPKGLGYQHMFSTDIFQKISNPPQV